MPSNALAHRPPHENQMDDVTGFISRWDDPASARPEHHFRLRRSDYGNVNTSGRPADYVAHDLVPHDAQWWDAIEAGVVPLVRVVVEVFGWVTYTSCAGHSYPDLNLEPKVRDIGVLPRDAAENAAVAGVLAAARDDFALRPLAVPAARVAVWRNTLRCVASRRDYPAYDLVLEPTGPWPAYFADLDAATSELVDRLVRLRVC
jgi:uncharacterized protein